MYGPDPRKSERRARTRELLERDAQHNRRTDAGQPHILILRDTGKTHARYNDHFLRWIERNHPRAARRIRLARLSYQPVWFEKTALMVPWLQDPLKERFPRKYEKALLWQGLCREHHVPIINPVEGLSRSVKAHALQVFARLGVRAIKAVVLTDPAGFQPEDHGLSFPFCIRENIIHSRPLVLVRDRQELARVDFARFADPLAVEFVDVQSLDGYYRKFRCLSVRSVCLPRHLIIANHWMIHAEHRLVNEARRREELEYMRLPEDPNRAVFNRLREALGFDTVAFDYSYDRDHNLVVWEPNPFPVLWRDPTPGQEGQLAYHLPTLDRLYRALAEFYFREAGLGHLLA